jgi:hypothetical protein
MNTECISVDILYGLNNLWPQVSTVIANVLVLSAHYYYFLMMAQLIVVLGRRSSFFFCVMLRHLSSM